MASGTGAIEPAAAAASIRPAAAPTAARRVFLTAAAQQKKKEVKLRIQKFALVVLRFMDEPNKHQWHPLHGSNHEAVPEGRFEGLVATFSKILIGAIDTDAVLDAVTALARKNELGAADRNSGDKTKRFYTVPRRDSRALNDATVYTMPYNVRDHKLTIPYHSLVLRDVTADHVKAEMRDQLRVSNQD
jgi:hypothetical protein